MTELSGTLDGIGLFPLLNFLGSLKAAGRLTISDRNLSGTLFFSEGRVAGATFGEDTGQVALDAIGLALGSGHFEFADGGEGDRQANLDLSATELQQHLEQLQSERQRIMAGIPSLESVPISSMEGPDEQPIALDRATLRLLLRCDGRHTVLELARESGLLATLKRLANLYELKLIHVESSRLAPEPVPAVAPAAETAPAADSMATPDGMPAPEPQPAHEPVNDVAAAAGQDTIIHEPLPREPAESAPAAHPRRPWWQGEER